MQLHCNNLGKRYNNHWIFRQLNAEFNPGEAVSVTGNNGSGKSTLLKVLAGYERYSEGTLSFINSGQVLDEHHVYRHIALCAPYQNLYEDLTAFEQFNLQKRFKPMRVKSFEEFVELLSLKNIEKKPLKNYSSGMRQRVKLALSILSDTPLLYLDEPLTNLDAASVNWYKELVADHISGRLVFVASNMNIDEYFFCSQEIKVEDLKALG